MEFSCVQKKVLAFALNLIIMKLLLSFLYFIAALSSFAQNNLNEVLKQQVSKGLGACKNLHTGIPGCYARQ
jgi:hypothetical protein